MSKKATVAIYAGAQLLDHSFKISIRQQVFHCWNYSSERRWKVRYIFVDQSRSERLAERTNFRHMVKEAKAGKFAIIILYGVRYLCSSQADLRAAEESLKQSGVRFHNVVNMDGQ
ncbi:recombinase family protein [Candidatus Bathyarchaeota archaeon]|nr:recombinase family protein [Candidatus Bathyarchaeota archaeon]